MDTDRHGLSKRYQAGGGTGTQTLSMVECPSATGVSPCPSAVKQF